MDCAEHKTKTGYRTHHRPSKAQEWIRSGEFRMWFEKDGNVTPEAPLVYKIGRAHV